jgi:hypothetical protein
MNKKKVAAIVAVEQHFSQEVKVENKITWSDRRPGWYNGLRGNWTKK